jgi:predicted amidohydrolase
LTQILTYPSAFTVPTGIAHWEVLLRSRAIESQAYVIAAAQVGVHNEKRTSYGHSMVVDPWGKVLLDLTGEGQEPEIGLFNIDLKYWEEIKEKMPLLRRT